MLATFSAHLRIEARAGICPEDELENIVLICPNHHHAAVHRDDAPFDYATLAFTFSRGAREPLKLNEHLPLAG